MCKCINTLLVGAVFFLCASAFANDEVDWSVFAAWCPASFDVCTESPHPEEVVLDEVVAPGYHEPNDDDARLFSELLFAYQALTQGQAVSDLDSYIHRSKADIEAREQLYRYAIGEGYIPPLSSRSELRHYRKELMYLKLLQAVNQKQMQLLFQDKKEHSELKAQVELQAHQLNKALFILKRQLSSDIETEEQILRYFIYKREQADE